MTPILLAKYLNKECTASEIVAVEDWQSANQSNAQELGLLEEIWSKSKTATSGYRPNEQVAWQKIQQHIQQDSSETEVRPLYSAQKKMTYWLMAAAMVLILGFGNWWLQRGAQAPMVEFASSENLQNLILPDGSKVTLNKHSKISYAEGLEGEERKLKLEGEAYFEVAHNPERPFIVYQENTAVKVLGTQFNLRLNREDESVEVQLAKGKVAFYAVDQKENIVELMPGEQAIYTSQSIQKYVISSPNYDSWKTGILSFDDMPLAQAIKDLQQHFHVKIEVGEELLKESKITAIFEHSKLENILDAVSYALDAEYEKVDSVWLLSVGK